MKLEEIKKLLNDFGIHEADDALDKQIIKPLVGNNYNYECPRCHARYGLSYNRPKDKDTEFCMRCGQYLSGWSKKSR